MREYHLTSESFICAESNKGLYDFGASIALSVKIVLIYNGKTKVWIDNKTQSLQARVMR